MAVYILLGIEAHAILTASVMTAPGTLTCRRSSCPRPNAGDGRHRPARGRADDVNVIDAAGRGTIGGSAPGPQRGRDAHLVSRARGADDALLGANVGGPRAARSPRADLRLGIRADRLGMGVPWRDAPTIGNLLGTRMALTNSSPTEAGLAEGVAGSTIVHDRDLRALRVRQLQLDRHPDRRHRRARAEPAPRPRAARLSRDDRGHPREPDHATIAGFLL